MYEVPTVLLASSHWLLGLRLPQATATPTAMMAKPLVSSPAESLAEISYMPKVEITVPRPSASAPTEPVRGLGGWKIT